MSNYELLDKSSKTFDYLSDDAPAVPPRRAITKKTRWTPFTLRIPIASAVIAVIFASAIGIEVAYVLSQKMNGFSVDFLSKFGSPQFFGSFLAVFFIFPFVVYVLTANHEIYRLQPFIIASHGNAPPQQSVLVSYVNQGRTHVALTAFKNGHNIVVISTILSFIANLWQPLAAALIVVRQTNHIVPDFSPIPVTATLGVKSDFTDLIAFVAAAGYVEAAAVHGLSDPPFVKNGWSVSRFDFPKQPKNATMALNAEAVRIDAGCETMNPVPTNNPDGSYSVTASRGNCRAAFSATPNDGQDPFGVAKMDNCSVDGQSTIDDDRFKPVVFWFFTFDGPTISMVFCSPTIQTYQVNVNVSLSTQLIGPEPTPIQQVSSNVTTGPPFNGFTLNGLFFPPPTPPNSFISARATTITSTLPNAMYRDALSNTKGLASSLRDISGQLTRVKKLYTQYLAISANSNYFVPTSSNVKPTVQTWMPRLWVDPFACHTLATALIIVALGLSILQYVHYKKRNKLYLAGPVGSIASDVSLTSSAKFGLLLNAGDTEKDLERKLHGMRFGIEESTGQIIVEKDNGSNILGHVRGEDTRYAPQEDVKNAKEDVRTALLSDVGALKRDSAVGLRNRESYATGSVRQSFVGSDVPLMRSPLPSASFSTTKFSPVPSPTPSNTVFVTSPATFTSPPSSSTAARFSTTSTMRYSAPPGPPPQLQARSSYYDPYAPYAPAT